MKTNSNICWIILLLTTLLNLTSCRSASSAAALNQSALYDPPIMTLMDDGRTYQFKEGVVTGRGQVVYSNYAYQNAFKFGLHPPAPILK